MTHTTHFILRLYGVRHMVKEHSNREEEEEVFYLTMHSTHFILRSYGVRHMAKDHSNREKGNPVAATYVSLSD